MHGGSDPARCVMRREKDRRPPAPAGDRIRTIRAASADVRGAHHGLDDRDVYGARGFPASSRERWTLIRQQHRQRERRRTRATACSSRRSSPLQPVDQDDAQRQQRRHEPGADRPGGASRARSGTSPAGRPRPQAMRAIRRSRATAFSSLTTPAPTCTPAPVRSGSTRTT